MRTHLKSLFLLAALGATGCAADLATNADCGDKCDHLGEFPAITTTPENVLFIPMSSGYLGLSENKWQSDDREFDRAMRELTAIYQAKGANNIVTMPRLQRWEDLDASLSEFAGQTFDRVIIVGHGALDGPITRGEASRTIEQGEDEGLIVEQWVMQPGLTRQYTTRYSEELFGDFVAENLESLLTQYDSVTDALFDRLTEEAQQEYTDCVGGMSNEVWNDCQTSCAESCQTFEGQERNKNCVEGCENQCWDDFVNEVADPACSPIYNEFEETLDEDAFNAFAASLTKVTADDGLIFLGFCNAATDADTATVPPAMGGHRSYTDLVAAATGRHASGPIGSTSGQDIINRVTALEKDRDQKFLYIAAPSR